MIDLKDIKFKANEEYSWCGKIIYDTTDYRYYMRGKITHKQLQCLSLEFIVIHKKNNKLNIKRIYSYNKDEYNIPEKYTNIASEMFDLYESLFLLPATLDGSYYNKEHKYSNIQRY